MKLEGLSTGTARERQMILIDIGLPTLNGIEVARRIRRSIPDSKIVFLTQESSADVVQEALSLGALGYVVKARAASELIGAMEAVRQGRRFISKELSDHDFLVANEVHSQCGRTK